MPNCAQGFCRSTNLLQLLLWLILDRYANQRCTKSEADRICSELITDPCIDLIVVQLLLESNKSKIQDRDGIDEGFRLKLRVAILHTREPIIREGVVDAGSNSPPNTGIVAADRDSGCRDGCLT